MIIDIYYIISSSCISGDVHHCLDGGNCGPAFPKLSWFFKKPFSLTMWPCSLCRIISSRSFPIVSNRHIGLYDEVSPRALLPFLSRTNLCFFQSAKNLPSRTQELKTSRRISGYAPINSLRISFGNPSIPGAVFALSLPPANLLVTILKPRPHGSFSNSPIMSCQHWSRLFFMPCLRADFAFFHVSCSRESPFERLNLRCAARHFRRRTDNWPFHQYIESPVHPCPRRGIEWSHAATTFRLAARTVSPNDPADLAKPSSSMSLVSSRFFCSLSLLSHLVFQERLLPK